MTQPNQDTFVGARVLGRYRIIRMLAKGGMGSIYLARTEGAAGFAKPVVIKRVLPQLVGDEMMVKMFVREAKVMASLHHPGIVAVTDFEREGDDYIMAMEYVHGHNLFRWMKFIKAARGPFPVEVATHIVVQVLEALHYAHTLTDVNGAPNPVIHRDVTPSNVLIDTQGHVKLLDFGIARTQREVTDPGGDAPVKGKFPYIAPEIFGGTDPSPATDVYSAAVLLHEVLFGRNEFLEKDLRSTLKNVMTLVPTRLDTVRRDVSAALADVIAKAVSKDPAERYATAHEFTAALRAVRTIGADEASAELARVAAEDFADPTMAELSGDDDLGTLDRAWRASLPPPERRPLRETEDTVRARAQPSHPLPTVAREGESSKKLRWLVLATAALTLCALVGIGVLFLRSREPAANAQVVYIQSSQNTGSTPVTTAGAENQLPEPTQTPPVATATPDAATTPTTSPPTVPSTTVSPTAAHHTATPHDPVTSTAALSRAFVRQQGRITRCFEANAADVHGNPEIAVRFQLDTLGRVTDAQLVPQQFASTGFAGCVLAIARSVNFGPQPAPVAFRIPISVRRVAGEAP